MDCAFREGDGWVLLDYKTDRVEDPAAFVARYAPQLRLYAQALEEITALPVRKCGFTPWATARPTPCRPGMPRRRTRALRGHLTGSFPGCIITYPRFAVAGKAARVRTGAGFSPCIPGV